MISGLRQYASNLSAKIRPHFCDWLFADRLYGG
ncbi:hypothetical protein T4B_1023 [Trichinella pseudospiralis]|uniref:Uncharacterized protein n=1 Tax=Trichinella pseudospiralis TaxID=6337 RepID=A0A0V1GQ98_TRIPS|nr:hypothetical protein T4B_14547 [Trichinella pseudospiralis]KRZ01944.1 hypothetical protein T4B_1023 [Trichinella pseudospiralis]